MSKNYNPSGQKIAKGLTVYVDGDVNKALRKFKKKVEESGLLQTLMEKQFYTKPTTERKRKKGAARARWLKKLKNEQLPKKNY
jgi:small subunit ribosomal protein S21